MYIIIEVNRDKVSLDNEEFKDYLVESLRSRGAKNEDIEEVKEDISKLKSNEKHTVYFDAKEVFTVIKDDIEKEDWIVELTESDNEIWSSDIDCNSREEAIEEGMKAAKEDGLSSFRIGRQEYYGMADIDLDSIIENAKEQLYNQVGEASETYLEDITKEQEKELKEALNEVFYDWHKKHKLFPNCYKILNDEVIEVMQNNINPVKYIRMNIRKYRKKSKMTQSEIAQKLNISVRAYRKYESGGIEPPLKKIIHIANIFDVSVSDLLEGATELIEGNKIENMNLYKVSNGYMGFAPINVLIVAANEERALELAREKFKSESERYGEAYHSNLKAELLGSAEKELVCEIEE